MTRSSSLVATALLACATVLIHPAAAAAAQPEPAGSVDLHSLPPGPRPFPVAIRGYLIDLERIEETTGTCALDGYLEMAWVDPRLRREAAPGLNRSRLAVQDVWWPEIEFYNLYEPRDTANIQVTAADDGRVVYEERFRARVACDLNFRRFPFDRQTIALEIESFRYDASEVAFTIRPKRQLRSSRAFLPDWFIENSSESLAVDSDNPDAKPYAMYILSTGVRRKSASYIWNIFIPLALITLLSWVVFWIRNVDFTNIAITTLVAAVAFAFVVSGSRPRQSYMTFMDAYVLASYVIIFLANIVAVAVHYLNTPARAASSAALARSARWVFPLVYVVLIAASIVVFFPPGR